MATEVMSVLRDLAKQNGQNVSYDTKTKNVQVGANVYTPAQLQSMGGQLVNGNRWTLPQSAASQIVGSASSWQSPAQQTQMSQMQSALQNMSGQYYGGQAAQLASTRDSQLKELQSAYADAISTGKSDIRTANSDYESQSNEINNQAYLDAEQTALYGNDMGIQNSQQMLGLMAGDNARKNTLINQNMTERDKRIADINDRLTALKTKRDLDIANTNSQYNSGLLQARSQAGQMYNTNMFGLMQDDYSANRTQQNTLKQMDYQSDITLKQMAKQQEFNLDTLAKSFDYDLQKMNAEYGYSTALQSQQAAANASAASQAYQQKIAYENYTYERDLERALNGTDPNTKEGKLIVATKKQELADKLQAAAVSTIADFQLSNTINNYNSVSVPVQSSTNQPSWLNSLFTDSRTGVNKKITSTSDAATKYQNEMNAYNNNPSVQAYQRMLQSLGISDFLN